MQSALPIINKGALKHKAALNKGDDNGGLLEYFVQNVNLSHIY
jgi:hypothetical protein